MLYARTAMIDITVMARKMMSWRLSGRQGQADDASHVM